MHKLTITEALAEVKLIDAKITKKQQHVLQHITRFSTAPDPFENEGGSQKVVAQELQALHDLGERRVRIRTAIAAANLSTLLTIGKVERSITGWLAWRREVGERQQNHLSEIVEEAHKVQRRAEENPPAYKDDTGRIRLAELVVNVSIHDLTQKAEEVADTLATLDGRLSLLNATTVIELED